MPYINVDLDASILAGNIIKIGKRCIDYGAEEVIISSVFVKESISLVLLLEKLMMNYRHQIKLCKTYFNHL